MHRPAPASPYTAWSCRARRWARPIWPLQPRAGLLTLQQVYWKAQRASIWRGIYEWIV